MYWTFLAALLRKTFSPTVRLTDALQIIAASAIPGIAKAVGVTLPADSVLAYIGAIAITFVLIRLLFWAPYALWEEQVEAVGRLEADLAKPQRLVMERLAKHRAKARAKLAAKLEDFQTLSFAESWDQHFVNQSAEQMAVIRRLEAEAGLSETFVTGRGRLLVIVKSEGNIPNADLNSFRKSAEVLRALQEYLMGAISEDELSDRLPQDLTPKMAQ